jgi:hypothetical protein
VSSRTIDDLRLNKQTHATDTLQFLALRSATRQLLSTRA